MVTCSECAETLGEKYIRSGNKFFCSLKCLQNWAIQVYPHFVAKRVIQEGKEYEKAMSRLREESTG